MQRLQVDTKEKAIEIFNRIVSDYPYDRIVETPTWYIFSINKDGLIVDPVGVDRRTGECRGIIPVFDVKDLSKGTVVYEQSEN